ncbi:hypothetical protein [Paenibacillus sp. 843]|uniref:hypothetical protein n=1 Tax=Paenibacillus sp. 843 TaxID=3341795 RepID=UPI0037289189
MANNNDDILRLINDQKDQIVKLADRVQRLEMLVNKLGLLAKFPTQYIPIMTSS